MVVTQLAIVNGEVEPGAKDYSPMRRGTASCEASSAQWRAWSALLNQTSTRKAVVFGALYAMILYMSHTWWLKTLYAFRHAFRGDVIVETGEWLIRHIWVRFNTCVIWSQMWSPNDYVRLGFEKYTMIVHKHPSVEK